MDGALVVLPEKDTREDASENNRLAFFLDFTNHLLGGFAGMKRIGVDQTGLAQHIQLSRFDEQAALAASAALVAIVSRHRMAGTKGEEERPPHFATIHLGPSRKRRS